MPSATEFAELAGPPPGGWTLALWHAYDPVNKVDLHATAVALAGRGLYFVDPIRLDPAALAELLQKTAETPPVGVLVTNGNHARAAAEFARHFSVPLCATAAAALAAGFEASVLIPAGGGMIFDGDFEAVPLSGAAAGEVAFYRADGGGLTIVGDALIQVGTHGFALLPDRYCADPGELRHSLSRLAERRFSTLIFAHGEPLVRQADERLRALLGK